MLFLILLIIIIIFLCAYIIKITNDIKKKKVKLESSRSSISIILEERYNILTNSVEVLKGLTKHEENIFNTTLHRPVSNMSTEQINKNITEQEQVSKNIIALGQLYPDIKSAEAFMKVMCQIQYENEKLSAAKRLYNNDVTAYNWMLVTFPNILVAKMFSIEKENFIKIDESETNDVNVKF